MKKKNMDISPFFRVSLPWDGDVPYICSFSSQTNTQALSVGIFPYVLKLLQSSAAELRQILVFIWAKILALDKSCQLDLVKDAGHHYFIGVLSSSGKLTFWLVGVVGWFGWLVGWFGWLVGWFGWFDWVAICVCCYF